MMKSLLAVALLIAAILFLSGRAGAEEYSQIVTVGDYTYEIEVGGTRDPVNETIIIENLGSTPLLNPRITVGGRFDWFDIQAMADEATRGCRTDEEKALAIFEFVRVNIHHLGSPGDREEHNPVIAINCYGYGTCSFHATAFVALCRAAGVPARVWEVWHHTVSEAFYNNAWHMLDSDIGLTYLMDDNRTIASIEQLWADQKITEGLEDKANLSRWSGRNKAIYTVYEDVEGGNAYVSQDGIRQRGFRYFHDDYFCYVQSDYDPWMNPVHTMAYTLRPQEKLIRNWKGGQKYYNHKVKQEQFARSGGEEVLPIRYGDGSFVWTPDMTDENFPLYLNQNYAPGYQVRDGEFPPVHTVMKQSDDYDFLTRSIFEVNSPWPIIGGTLKARLYRGGSSKWDRLQAMLYSPDGPVSERLWRAPRGESGSFDVDVSLDEPLYPTGERGRHNYHIDFQFAADRSNDPPTQSGVEQVELTTDIQVAPNSLPALSRGRNVIRYRDETPGEHKVKITHIWRERSDNTPPSAPAAAVFPADGARINTTAPEFKWRKAVDPDKTDKVADHWIMISFDPQCRWPVATALWKLTDSGDAKWRIPEGWLNGDTTYYWKVKARDSRGVWGEWSPVFRFATD